MLALILLFLFSPQLPVQSLPNQAPAVPAPAVTYHIQSPAAKESSPEEDYKLGPDDVVDVAIFEVPELGGTARVSASGFILLPLIGSIKAAGLDSTALARVIEDELRKKYIKDPHVTVGVREFTVESVSVLGAVRSAGVQPLRKPKPLLDVLAAAGGLNENAAEIQVIRNSESNVISISVQDLLQNAKTELNIPIYGGDVVNINVLQTNSFFLVGELQKPGEYPLKLGKGTVRQAIAIGGGFTKEAKKDQAKLIRYHEDGTKEEIPLNLQKIMQASYDDTPLMPNDILFIPAAKSKRGITKTLDVAIAVVSMRLVYIGR